VNDAWRADAAYMEWAKLHSSARYGLATSGVEPVRLRDFPGGLPDLELTGDSGYGYPPLLDAIAAHTGARPENVVLAAGTSMANHLALAALLEPGDEVLVEEPAYPLMAAAARYLHARVTTFPRRFESAFRIDPDRVRAALTPATRVIVVTNLHNPGSVLADEAELRALAALAEERGAWLLVDEVYLDAVFDVPVRSAVHLGPAVLVTSSLTKVYGLSGLRCGWILAPAGLARDIWRLNDVFAASPAHVPERVSVAAFAHLPELRDRARRRLEANRPVLDAFLDGRDDLDCVRTRWGTTAFPRLHTGDVEALCTRLREAYETSVVPGRFFGAPQHVRIGLGGPTDLLAEGLRRLGRALDDLRRPVA
jgi:aspartate/methionine/tyrosine aminotransferase